MKRWFKAFLPKPVLKGITQIRERWFDSYAQKSYAQEGEDIILERFLQQRQSGFYVDVGAHHPKRFSNTYRLYRRGWTGLNIDANPGSMTVFRRDRPRDINVEAAVSSTRQQLTYYIFNEPALNTFNKKMVLEHTGERYSVVKEVAIMTVPLWELLDQYVPAKTKIDVLTVDVEGLDYDVLQSNDWSRYSPEFILVECLGAPTIDDVRSNPMAQLLYAQNYSMVARTLNSVLFRLTEPASTGA